ncbi:hypothetical protein SETIT_4G245800v2 [Setaria italica]|uniref:Uncharacterized protein n=1 Tax=Setaria italica TaxID=4555 RepID=A0A368QXV0_SETIT|nr:hypothetical protein SETIT_4G245800v2 [Setaria italica]
MRSPDPPPSTPPRSTPRTGPSCASTAPMASAPLLPVPPPSPILLHAVSPSLSPSRSAPWPPWTSRRPSQPRSPCPSLRPSPSRPRASTLSPMSPCTLSSAMAPSGGGGRRAAIRRRRGPAGRDRGPRHRSARYSTRGHLMSLLLIGLEYLHQSLWTALMRRPLVQPYVIEWV